MKAATYPARRDKPADAVFEILERLQALASNGDWSDVEALARKLERATLDVPEAERRAVLVAVIEVTDRLAGDAKRAQRDIGGRLQAIRRGQAATRAYEMR